MKNLKNIFKWDSSHAKEKNHRWISTNKSAEGDWSSQRCFIWGFISLPPSSEKGNCKNSKSIWSMRENTQMCVQIYLPGHWLPNSFVMFLRNKHSMRALTYIYLSLVREIFRQHEIFLSLRRAVCLGKHLERPVEAVFMCAGFTHRLLWWVRQMSSWPGEFWDCVAWERKRKWFGYEFQQDKRKTAILALKLVPGLLTGTPLLLSHSGLLWVDDSGSSHHDRPIFTWHRLMKGSEIKQRLNKNWQRCDCDQQTTKSERCLLFLLRCRHFWVSAILEKGIPRSSSAICIYKRSQTGKWRNILK